MYEITLMHCIRLYLNVLHGIKLDATPLRKEVAFLMHEFSLLNNG